MKKSVLFRIALVMLVLTMVTSCFVGGTFAKYVTSGQGGDSARVAAFGVTVTGTSSTFAEVYASDSDAAKELATNSVVSVAADNEAIEDNLVAPGTSGNMVAYTITGIPEVAVNVAFEVTNFDIGDKWVDADGAYYCPLVIKVGETTIKGLDCTDAAEFEGKVIAAVKKYSKDYEALTNLADIGADAPAISWEWPFHISDDNDVKDTYLGDRAAAQNAATVALTVKATVTQLD